MNRTWDTEEEEKRKHNFITAVISEQKDLCGGSDPGSTAYLQTRSSNTSGQVISYALIRRDDMISPIRKQQHYDSQRIHCRIYAAEWNSESS